MLVKPFKRFFKPSGQESIASHGAGSMDQSDPTAKVQTATPDVDDMAPSKMRRRTAEACQSITVAQAMAAPAGREGHNPLLAEGILRPSTSVNAICGGGASLIAAHPLPEALQDFDPYARQKTKSRRTGIAPLKASKGKPTSQAHKETFYAAPTGMSKSIDNERLARQKMRLMLGGGKSRASVFIEAQSWRDAASWMNQQDESLLQKCESMDVLGAALLTYRSEMEHIARFGLLDDLRLRAREVLKKNDPFSLVNWKRVRNPANGAAHNFAVLNPSVQNEECAVTFEPSIELVMPTRRHKDGTRAPAVAELIAPDGVKYLVTAPVTRGGFKRFGVGLNQEDQPVGILMIRGRGAIDVFDDGRACREFGDNVILAEIENITKFSDDFELYQAFSVNNMWFLVVPLFDGGDLRSALCGMRKSERERATVHLLPDMIRQIMVVHRKRSAIHGDVKLENFLLKSTGEVVLADFGLTKFWNINKVLSLSLNGTFLAPEQTLCNRVTPAIDFWALGASLGDAIIYDRDPLERIDNPLYPVMDQNGNFGLASEQETMFMFTLYRQHLFEADGLFNVHRLYEVFPDAQITARFFPYFSRFYQRAPLLASFCLEYLLEPNAAVRTQNEDEILELALLMRTAIEDGARPASQTEDGSTPKPVTFRQDPGVAAAIASLKEARQSLSEGQTVAA